MKKWFCIAFLTFTLFVLAVPAYASSVENNASIDVVTSNHTEKFVTVQYGAKTVICKKEVVVDGDFAFLPLREVLEAYGASLQWAEGEAETKVIITAGQDRCQLVIDLDKQLAYGMDGKEYLLRSVNGSLFLPVHFFVQLVNCEVSWDRENYVLVLHSDQYKPDVAKVDTAGNVHVSRWILNLPVYEKTMAFRYGGMRPGNGEIYETGKASYYGGKFHGRKTASGEIYNQNALTAAHKTLPFGTIVRVTAEWNQSYVDVRITDRGPFKKGRVIDLSTAAAAELGMLSMGVGNVTLEVLAWPE